MVEAMSLLSVFPSSSSISNFCFGVGLSGAAIVVVGRIDVEGLGPKTLSCVVSAVKSLCELQARLCLSGAFENSGSPSLDMEMMEV